MPRLSFAALLLLLASAAGALDPRNALTQYGHTAWRVRDGYFSGPPTALAQTQDGFLWIGTDAGLIGFDGVRFLPWTPPPGARLPDDRIISLLGTRDGSLWIGTAGGLARWHGSSLTVYARAGRFGALLEDRRGTVWAGHTRAQAEVPPLCRFEGGRFQCFRFPDEDQVAYVGALYEDRQGDVWIGGGGGACRWRPEGLDCHPIAALASQGDKAVVFALAAGSAGDLWAATGSDGVWRRSGGGWTSYPGPPEPALDAGEVFSDREGGLCIGTKGSGLIRSVQGRTERFNRADGLSADDVEAVFEDREGSVWVTTSSGLDRFRDVKVATLTPREGLPGGIFETVTASRDGSVWAAERRALVHLEKTGISSYGTAQGLPGAGPTSLLEDSRGRLWLGVDNGLAWREKGRFFPFRMPDGSALGVVRSIVEDREGDVWVATTQLSRAVVRIRDGRVVETLGLDRLGGQQASAMAADPKGGVWIGSGNRVGKLYPGRGFEPQGSLGDPGSQRIRQLLPDARGLWVATSRGLALLRNGRLNVLDRRGGLPCEDIEDIVAGDGGSLWMKSACGLVQIPGGDLAAWIGDPGRRVRVRWLDALDGAQAGLSPFSPRAARSLDGRLWLAVEAGGLQVFDPRHERRNALPPPVRILRAIADRKTYPAAPGLRLPPLTRDLEIDYTALSLAVPEKVRFRYRLEGAGGDWQDAGARREAFFTNLRPGSYRFHVLACNSDGVWNREGATLDFAVLPAFHQTRGFFALCVVALVGLIGMAYRWRVRQVRASLDRRFEERLAERTRIAQDLHDTLLQGVLSASMQLYVAVEELPPGEPARGRLERVQELMRQVIEEGRGALRGLRSAAAGAAEALESSLSRVPEELGSREAVEFRVVVEGRPRPLRPVARDEIYRIAREALVNAFRHSGGATIEVEIEYAPRQLRVRVRDDGGGIDAEMLRSGREDHWGLSGMRERAERIGARLQVWSRAGSGTEIELRVPGGIVFADAGAAPRGGWARRLASLFGRRAGNVGDHDLAAPEEPRVERERSRAEQEDGGGHQDHEDRGGGASQHVGDGGRE